MMAPHRLHVAGDEVYRSSWERVRPGPVPAVGRILLSMGTLREGGGRVVEGIHRRACLGWRLADV